jgi:hypothetical protein
MLAIGGALLTWRCLVSRLWSGLSGRRLLFGASVMSVFVAGAAAMMVGDAGVLGWILADPRRTAIAAWIAAGLVILKGWTAAWTWRRVSARYVRQYIAAWLAAATCLVVLSLLFWNVIRIYVALDVLLFQALMVFVAVLALPLARVGLAPSSLARNRHR